MTRRLSLSMVIGVAIVSLFAALLFVLSQGIDVDYEYNLYVTSDTTLWNPGTHEFAVNGTGHILSPVNETFPLEGTGKATYSVVGPGPPGQFNLDINFTTNLTTSFFTGSLSLSGSGSGETVLVEPSTQGFIRTEELRDFSVSGTYNGLGWNSTTDRATVDFSSIGMEGKSFDIRVQGTSHLSLESPPPQPVSERYLPMLLGITLAGAIVVRRSAATLTGPAP